MIFQTKAAPLIPNLWCQWILLWIPGREESVFVTIWQLVHLSQREVSALLCFRNTAEISKKKKNQVTDTSYICFLVVWVSYSLVKDCKLMAVKPEIFFFFIWGCTERPPAAWTALTDTFRSIPCEIAAVTGSSSVQVDQSCHLCFQVVMNRPVVPQVPLESQCLLLEKRMWWATK